MNKQTKKLFLKLNHFSDVKEIFVITLGFSIIIFFAIYLTHNPSFLNQMWKINRDNVFIETEETEEQSKQNLFVQQATTLPDIIIETTTNSSVWHNSTISILICLIVIGMIITLIIWYRQTCNKQTKTDTSYS